MSKEIAEILRNLEKIDKEDRKISQRISLDIFILILLILILLFDPT